jgi:acetyltransferase-like isoleucine patch superfamily enzyme
MQSQLRQHIKFSFIKRLRVFYYKRKVGFIGKHVYLEKNIEFLRFPRNISIGNDVIIKSGSKICSCNRDALISIGDNTTIGYYTFIFSSNRIDIGADCLIAPFVYIVDSDHQAKKSQKINKQPNISAPISIGNDVWIASNVTILKGVNIGDGAIIAANSVVNCDLEPYSIYGGSPARKVNERK